MLRKLWIGALVTGGFAVGCGGSNREASAPDDRETADFRAGYIEGCLKDKELDAFCSCSADGVIRGTTPEERRAENPRLQSIAQKNADACADKIPESYVRKSFIAECSSNAALANFCGCSYEYYAKNGLLDAEEAELAAKQSELASACSDALFVDTKTAFLTNCRTKASADACECVFSKLEMRFGKKTLLAKFSDESGDIRSHVATASAECK